MWVNVWAEIFQLCNQNGLSMGDGGFSMGWRMNAYVDVVTNAGGIGPLLILCYCVIICIIFRCV